MSMPSGFREGFPERVMFNLGLDDASGVLQVEDWKGILTAKQRLNTRLHSCDTTCHALKE